MPAIGEAGLAGLPRVSIVIPHLNTPELLARCLDSVLAQSLDHGRAEVIVVDNGSRLPLDAVIAAYPGVRFLAEPVPGPGPARNRGIAAAAAPALVCIDADCRAAPGWLQTAVDAIEADPGRAVIGGDVRIDFVDPAHLTGTEAYEAVFGFRQRMYIETRHFSITANLGMAAAVFEAVGPFGGIDIAEDYDWGRRAFAAGFPTRFVPAMRVFHPARADLAALARKWQRHIRHDRTGHEAGARPEWRWQVRALAMLASVPVESLKLLTSERLSGFSNRLRGIGILARIRAFRFREMRRVAREPAESGGAAWNRQP